jgi:hypothetical protein
MGWSSGSGTKRLEHCGTLDKFAESAKDSVAADGAERDLR